MWLKVAVARVAKVSRTLESCDLVVALVVLLPSDFTKKRQTENKDKQFHRTKERKIVRLFSTLGCH